MIHPDDVGWTQEVIEAWTTGTTTTTTTRTDTAGRSLSVDGLRVEVEHHREGATVYRPQWGRARREAPPRPFR